MSKILIVDDDVPILEYMRQVMVSEGYDVMVAATGKEAISCLEKNYYDLLITDIRIPDIDGLQIIDAAVVKNVDITILAISGYSQDFKGHDLLDEAMDLGADAVLGKPFSADEMIRTVKALLR